MDSSVRALTGLVRVHIARGGEHDLALADKALGELPANRRRDPMILYLTGLVAEKSGETDKALEHYRQAAEQLLHRQPQTWEAR